MGSIRAALLLLLAAFCAVASASAPRRAPPDRVRVENGTLEGLGVDEYGVRRFFGVPYAAPPVGSLRFRAPARMSNWRRVRDAKAFSARCMQERVFDDMVFRSPGVSEDCLYLNIWTPAHGANERLPVLVYFYGGGYIAGDGSENRYDGEAMAKRGVVSVTINYRLGIFGFFAHPLLREEAPQRASGNYGLLDHVAALQWVRRNITAFGGDPARVTIAGESAGSASVSAMMASPLAQGLFAGAIGESGSILEEKTPRGVAESAGEMFANAMGLETLQLMREIPADQLLHLASRRDAPDFGPIVDGYLFPVAPREVFEAGRQAHVPLLAGSNSAEGGADAILGNGGASLANYRAAVQRLYGASADDILRLYPAQSDGEPVLDAAQTLASDRFIAFETWDWMDLATRTGGAPTFYYYYAHPRPSPRAGWVNGRARGAVHSGEIEYALGNLATNEVYDWNDDDWRVSDMMLSAFANFVKTGDPNGPGAPAWPQFSTGQKLIIDVNPRAAPDDGRARYEFLRTLAH